MNPFRGLQSYERGEKLFGRDDDLALTLVRIANGRTTLLFAASGVGKTSFLNAKVIPEIEQDYLVCCFRGWSSLDPAAALLSAVRAAFSESASGVASISDPIPGNSIASALSRLALRGKAMGQPNKVTEPRGTVLILDQFEELFQNQRDPGRLEKFIRRLERVINDRDIDVRVVFAIREEFLGELSIFDNRIPDVFANYYRLKNPTRRQAEDIIEETAKVAGVSLSPKIDRLLNDLAGSAPLGTDLRYRARGVISLPYLQIACQGLWDKRPPDSESGFPVAYSDGESSAAVGDYCAKHLDALPAREQEVISEALGFLITKQNAKIAYDVATLAEHLGRTQEAVASALSTLADDKVRILRRYRARAEETWFELYHDVYAPFLSEWNAQYRNRQKAALLRAKKISQRWAAGMALLALVLAGSGYRFYAKYKKTGVATQRLQEEEKARNSRAAAQGDLTKSYLSIEAALNNLTQARDLDDKAAKVAASGQEGPANDLRRDAAALRKKAADLENESKSLALSASSVEVGQWSAIISLPNVPIHTHLLPTGKVLFWGRRNPPGTPDFSSLNQHQTHAFIWDPANPLAPAKPTRNQPTDTDGIAINLFGSGHTFLADGRLLVTGGYLFDGQGLNTSTFYDPFKDQWTAGPTMNNGRWYPTAVTLPDGRAFVISGSFATGPLAPPLPDRPIHIAVNAFPQILENGNWDSVSGFDTLPLDPRIHVAPNGFLFMSGSLATTYYFENLQQPGDLGTWAPIAQRSAGNAEYAPSVMYDVGKVVFIGGGTSSYSGGAPTNIVETIDLNAPAQAWAIAAPMKFRRRQHNATLLPDGTVLVTGGTQGGGFNNLDPGQPVHIPELWDPSTGTWAQMAPEAVDRCYHSTAVLLPDGRVFSGGGGEYAPTLGESNPPVNTHADAQLFSPPYLFKGARPIITKAPAKVALGEAFVVETPAPNEVNRVTWVRLGSVNNSFNQNQRINFLAFTRGSKQLTVTAPANANVCPPGHYMLFLLNHRKVPSIASIIQITAPGLP